MIYDILKFCCPCTCLHLEVCILKFYLNCKIKNEVGIVYQNKVAIILVALESSLSHLPLQLQNGIYFWKCQNTFNVISFESDTKTHKSSLLFFKQGQQTEYRYMETDKMFTHMFPRVTQWTVTYTKKHRLFLQHRNIFGKKENCSKITIDKAM